MNIGDFRENWALFIALPLLAIAAFVVVMHLLGRSARGQLRSSLRKVARRRKEFRKAGRNVRRVEKRLARLNERADTTRPRIVQEAKEDLADAKALQKVAHDQVLVAENDLRQVIHDEFPPRDHDELRQKYLPAKAPDTIPFSFEE